MYLFEKSFIIVLCLKLINAEVLICDNNECKRASLISKDSLFSELRAIVEDNQNTTKFLTQLNERIEHKITALSSAIGNIKQVVEEQAEKVEPTLYDDLWVVIQRRQDGLVDFYRNWTDYKNGFGNQLGEFFVGLDKISEITNERDQELLIMLEDFNGNIKFAHYDHFLINNETDRYRLQKLGKYKGTAGDHLRLHVNMFFSTKDQDNDYADEGNCAEWFKGAWWYYHCMSSNLNGPYRHTDKLTTAQRGIGVTWGSFDEILYSYKSAQIMLRIKENPKVQNSEKRDY